MIQPQSIQGLNQKLNEKDAEIQALKQSVAELKETLTHLTQKPN
jgi:prefoldin subunit 5